MQDKDPGTRCYATMALGHAGKAARPFTGALKKGLVDSDPEARVEATPTLHSEDTHTPQCLEQESVC
eukprot:876231-Amphidinium_carterae.1